MAKALLGYVGGTDPRLATEVQRLRRRVTDLEAQILRLQTENDQLAEAAVEHGRLALDDTQVPQPALT
ncbi:hypothetical protein [Jiangella asiatica]|uniref:Uncharacterized protein n=1 Tax=Jiangella asiatica TaxID=2530372 RepID=A0A4R5CN32_9ACTN|nr:hypothetical protein [Jiangella asiatica]TDD98974.1 hypothetical protein E1269_27850 [Jiangella asiatica]